MDVILLNGGLRVGKWYMRSQGPYKIAHWLRKHGFSTQVIDNVEIPSEDLLYSMIKSFMTSSTMVIGVSSTFFMTSAHEWDDGSIRGFPQVLTRVLRTLKNEYPGVKVIAGGFMSERTIIPVFDASMMSYREASEDVMLEYVQHLRNGTPLPRGRLIFSPYDPTFKRMHFESANNPKFNIEHDDFKFTEQDIILPGEPLPLEVARGCIFACNFCQYPNIGKKKLDYIRGMEYVEQQLIDNYEKFGTTSYLITDDTFNESTVKLQAFYEMSQRLPFRLSYSAYIRADLVKRFPESAYLLKESGLTGAYHGVESLHPVASRMVSKGWSAKEGHEFIPSLFHDIWKKEVAQHLSFIVGLPGETDESITSTVDWFLQNDLHRIIYNPLGLSGPADLSYRGVQSDFDRNLEKYGYTLLPSTVQGLPDWKNEHWTRASAAAKATELSERVQDHVKQSSWIVQTQKWYGYDQRYIMDTPVSAMSGSEVLQQSISKVNEYFSRLTNKPIVVRDEPTPGDEIFGTDRS